MPSLDTLQATLGYRFHNTALLQLSLTHPSLAHEVGAGTAHNQRLEFLGDAVLQLALTNQLYGKFPDYGEGPLTKARAQLVNRTTLAEQGRRLKLGDYLILSRGEETSGGRSRNSALADGFEAVIGAVFLDGGYEVTRDLIETLFTDAWGDLGILPNLENPKGELQELLQANSPDAPCYELISASGPDHNRSFESAVLHHGVELARGIGRSKKLAESEAAMAALLKLRADRAAVAQRSAPSP